MENGGGKSSQLAQLNTQPASDKGSSVLSSEKMAHFLPDSAATLAVASGAKSISAKAQVAQVGRCAARGSSL